MKKIPLHLHFLFLLLGVICPHQALALSATGFFPAPASTNICPDTPLKITFDTAPTVGTSGTVKIYQSNGTLVDTLDLALNAGNGTQARIIGGTSYNAYPILVTGTTASIFPKVTLAYNTSYYVTIDATVFPTYAGLSGTAAWTFKTKTSGPSTSLSNVIVAADGTGDFCTVQGAVNFVPAANTVKRYINIRNGTYQEIVRVASKHNLAFRGQHRKRTIISYPNNNNINPATSTRSLFGAIANDISFDNLTLLNSTPNGGSQAEALRVNGLRCVVNNCDLRSYQDTFLINSDADTAYIQNSLVEGNTDFIWGSGRVVFKNCEIKSLSSGYICQMRNHSPQYGAVFIDCRLTRSAGVTNVYLARIDPNAYPDSSVAFIRCAMDNHIIAAGWLLTASPVPPVTTAGLEFWEYAGTDLAGTALTYAGRAAFSTRITLSQATALENLSTTFGGWTPVPPLPAFPGAEGAGANALGGRGGDVYYVTNLNDSGAGSFRDAINTAPAAGRTVLFKTSGTIPLSSNLTITKPRVTVAGQTAPGGGICLKNYTFRVQADDVVVRHIRSRLGTDANREDDAITVLKGINIVIDHCSASWSVDEVFSCTDTADNVTIQWCMITEALDNSIHSKGPHGFGSLMTCFVPARYSVNHCLYAHNQSRNPRPGGGGGTTLNFDFRNNVLYNWGYYAGYTAGSNESTDMNYIGNYLVKGPGSTRDAAFVGGSANTRIYQAGNRMDLNKNGVFDGSDTGWGMFTGTHAKMTSEFDFSQSNSSEAATVALQRVLSEVGTRQWSRDTKDAAIIGNVVAGNGGFVNTPAEAGGYPVLTSTQAPIDSDNDGMPDFWELANGLSSTLADNNGDANGNGYTNLEEYLNWLAEPNALTPTGIAVDVDVNLLNGNRTGLTYNLSNAVNGAVALQPDGKTARFTPTTGFQGLASFNFSYTTLGSTITRKVTLVVTSGLPKDLKWVGSTAVWDIDTTSNFNDGTAAAKFKQGDRVTFDQTGVATSVTLTGVINPSSVTVDATKDYTIGGTGSLGGTMNLAKSGSGKLTLNTANTFSGGTDVTGGSLAIGNAAGAGTGTITFTDATFAIGALKPLNPLVVNGVNSFSGGSTGGAAGFGAVTGDGRINLTITTGVFDLFGSLTGFNGTLALASGNTLRCNGTTGGSGMTLDLGTGNGAFFNRSGTAAIAIGALQGGALTKLSGASNSAGLTTYTVGAKNLDTTFSGTIENGVQGPTALTKVGTETLSLTGANTYTGATLVSSGTLALSGSLASTAVTVSSGAEFLATGSIAGSVNIQTGGLLVVGQNTATTLAVGTGLTLTDTELDLDLTNNTTIGGGVNDFISMGGGVLTLGGTITLSPNLLNGPLASGTYTIISGGTSTVLNTPTFVWTGETGGRQTVTIDTSTPGALKLVVTGTPAFLKWRGTPGTIWDAGDPALPATGAANWLNGVATDRFVNLDRVTFDDTLVSGTAVLSGNVSPKNITVSNATKPVTINGTGSITGSGTLTKSGAALFTLDGTHTFTGGTTLTGGTLKLASDAANAGALGSGPITFLNGTLEMNSNFNTSQNSDWDLIVPIGYSGTLKADSRCGLLGTLTGGGTFNLEVTNIRTDNSADWSAFSGQFNINADADGARYRIGNSYVPFSMPLAAVTLGPKAEIEYLGILNTGVGTTIEFGSLSGDSSTKILGGPTTGRVFTWKIGARNTDTTFAGTIAEQLAGCTTGFTKTGTGTMRLTGTSTHTGPTLVSAGKLIVNGALTLSPVNVDSGATLGGTGQIPATNILADATLSPGENGAGTLITGSLTLDSDSSLRFDIGATSDRVQVNGDLDLDGTLNVTDLGGMVGNFTLFTYTGTLTGGGLTLGSVPAGSIYQISTATAGQVILTVKPVDFAAWQRGYFTASELLNPTISGAAASPAGDGISNLMKYALGLLPKTPSTTGVSITFSEGLWKFIYQRPADRPDLVYAVQVSTDLGNTWTSSGVTHVRTATGPPETWQGSRPPNGDARLFFRLFVTRP